MNFKIVNPHIDSLMKSGLIAAIDGNPLKYKTPLKKRRF